MMALADIVSRDLGIKKSNVGILEDITPERLKRNLPKFQQLLAFWREYPDLFIDYLCSLNPHNTFHFFFYQRTYLRCVMRYKYIFCCFPRAYSKSFLAVMCLMIRAILYPGAQILVASGGKERKLCSV